LRQFLLKSSLEPWEDEIGTARLVLTGVQELDYMLVTKALECIPLPLEMNGPDFRLSRQYLDRHLAVDVAQIERLVHGGRALLQRPFDDVVPPADCLHARTISYFLEWSNEVARPAIGRRRSAGHRRSAPFA
jgi:hypothetical protein